MNCGIILFIYDRPQCTVRVLETLKKNNIAELYIFQDGLGERTNKIGWEQNIEIVSEINWCNIHYERNVQKSKSLDEQIVFGINKVFEEKNEIIVVEDDCIISDDCIEFMKKCFDIYKNNAKIIDVGAYLEPIRVPEKYKLSVIAAGIPSGQVWGTWKDRWEEFQNEFFLIKRIGDSFKNNKFFESCGYPIKKILTDYWLLGTWDLWWSIYVLISGGIAVRPRYNKVYNIGFENPGTHTSGDSPWVVPISKEEDITDDFPLDLKIEPWADVEFSKFYRKVNGGISLVERQTYYRNFLEKWINLKQQGGNIGDILLEKNIEKIVVYGTGTIGEKLINELIGKIQIEYFVVSSKKDDTFMGYPIFCCDEKLPEKSKRLVLIVIPGYDLKNIEKTMKNKFSKIYSIDSLMI